MPRRKTKKRSYRKKGGENTSPNKAAKRIQSRFRGNKSRKLTEIKKQLETLDPDLKQSILDMIGRGKKKKSKKLTNKKRSKKRSVKKGGS